MSEEKLQLSAEPVWTRRDRVRAFYSGHSLTDGVPEALSEIASSLGRSLDFEFQSIGYSLLRDRTRGPVLGAESADSKADWSGYRSGKNRVGEGLDVARELEAPTRLPTGERYDALIVTERHDIAEAAARAQTPTFLVDIARRAWVGNPDAEVFLYHSWMPIDVADPLPWVSYERATRRVWECVASRANLTLNQPKQRVRVLPGASALADLVGELWRGSVPGLSQLAPSARVKLFFRDDVHMSALGTYFMGLVHYAVLYGQSPHGALGQPGVEVETAAHLQGIASRHAVSYGRMVDAAVSRDMATCRTIATEGCAALHAFRAGNKPWSPLKQKAQAWRCARRYGNPNAPDNPFRD